MITLTPSGHSGSREQAQELAAPLGNDLSDQTVTVDCGPLLVSSPSFFDELIKQVLIQRRARTLVIENAAHRLRNHAERSASNRGVADRLMITEGGE
jgi:hypothetical protein